MAENSGIEWTHHTFNPWWGCTKVSPGCDHCYAERDAKRFAPGRVLWGVGAPRRIFDQKHWHEPVKWNRRAQHEGRRFRVFCASMADVFDKDGPEAERRRLFDLIDCTPHLDWLLLTKRIGNVERMVPWGADTASHPWPSNLWLGISVVNQAEADRDIPKLLAVPARIRFLSIEPMLGPIDLSKWMPIECVYPRGNPWRRRTKFGEPDSGLSWVIVGGESGPGARPMHPDWARSLRDQCAAADVPYLFKQWGEWTEQDDSGLPGVRAVREGDPEFWSQAAKCQAFMAADGELIADLDDARDGVGYRGLVRLGKKAAGRLLDGVTHDGYPVTEAPHAP